VRLIDGRAIAREIRGEVSAAITSLRESGLTPVLTVVVATDDPATAWYVRSIERAAAGVGVSCLVEQLKSPGRDDIAKRLDELSADPAVHGIICQTPLPEGVSLDELAAHISPAKDVDGANPVSLGRLAFGLPTFVPATAAAVREILVREKIPLVGARAVIVGRSTVVGKPLALLLLAENATVTVCHSRTSDLPAVCAEGDILIAAAGRAGLIGRGHVRPGAVVIDVGTNQAPDGSMVGDVDEAAITGEAAVLAPVPGGVGPVTVMLLLQQTVAAAARSR
jgi:methylenetetrahydrofolate dehydrogenase (NADP+)/methenyltetrahydrofolate cyclohydrolase